MWCCMPSLVEILCCLDEEIGLVYWQLVHDMHAMEILDISSICNMLRAYERNQCLENSCLISWRPIV